MRFLLLLLVALPVIGANWVVSPSGSGDGTTNTPGALSTAMAHTGWAASIAAGDTVYYRAGTYTYGTNIMYMQFSGATNNLVTWRNYPGERAIINHPIYFTTRDYHRFIGLEFYDSNKAMRPGSIGYFDSTTGVNYEWINCIIHDTPAVWTGGSAGQSVRGCIIWYPGKEYNDHTMYPYCKDFSGNLVGWCAAQVVQLGTPGILVRSNIIFGTAITVNNDRNSMLISDADGGVVSGNCLFDTVFRGGGIVAQGTTAITTLFISNNIVAANGTAIRLNGGFTNIVLNGNTWFDTSQSATGYPLTRSSTNGGWTVNNNAYYARTNVMFANGADVFKNFTEWKADTGFDSASTATASVPPDSVTVFPNADEPKRAHVAIYNWSGAHNVNVSLSGVLANGDWYRVYSAQNYAAGPIRTGTYDGSPISLPMTNLTVAPILYVTGLTQPTATGTNVFGAFVITGARRTLNVTTLNVGGGGQ